MYRVLIVDDDPVIDKIYRNLFERHGFRAEVINDGEHAIESLKSNPPHIVLLDLFLPKIPGVDVLKFIRSRRGIQKMPVIVFSSNSTSRYVDAAWKAGATRVVGKDHFEPQQIFEMVRTTLEDTARDNGETAPFQAQNEGESKPKPAAAPAPQNVATKPAENPAGETDEEAMFQAEIRQAFLNRAPQMIAALRGAVDALRKEASPEEKSGLAAEFAKKMGSLAGKAQFAGLGDLAQAAKSIEKFGKELCQRPASINPSALRIMAQAVGRLDRCVRHIVSPSPRGSGSDSLARDVERGFLADIRQVFLKRAPELTAALQAYVSAASGETNAAPSLRANSELSRQVRLWSGNARTVGFFRAAQRLSAFGAMLALASAPANAADPFWRRAVSRMASCVRSDIETLAGGGGEGSGIQMVLVLDEDRLSNESICSSLLSEGIFCLGMDDPGVALTLLEHDPFDLIIAKLQMAGMHGLDFLAKFHGANSSGRPASALFLTSLEDFNGRLSALPIDGVDWIAEPCSPLELQLKVSALIST